MTETGRPQSPASVLSTDMRMGRHVDRPKAQASRRYYSYLGLLLALALFLGISLYQLSLPGFYYDEALDLAPMLQVLHGESTALLRDIGITIGSVTYPVMLLDYMGSLNGYLTLPFMAMLGPGVLAARIEPIFFSAITIMLSYALARAWFGRDVALVTALLLAVNPSFIWFSRQGISVTSVMTVFSTGSLLLIDVWRKRAERKRRSHLPLLVAGVLLGLGLWAKFLFLWWIVVVAVVAVVWVLLHRAEDQSALQPHSTATGRVYLAAHPWLRSILHNLSHAIRALPWLVIGFAIGAAPLIYFNLHDLLSQPFDLRNAYTLGLLFKSLGQTTDYGVNNLDVWTNLGKAIADFNVFMDGSYFWYNGVPFSNVYAVPAFFIAVITGSLLVFRRPAWRKWLALLAAIVATVFISAFTVSGLWATHLFIILPLPQMVVAAAAVWLARAIGRWRLEGRDQRSDSRGQRAERGKWSAILNSQSVITILSLLVFLALPLTRDLWVSQQHHATLGMTGGSGRFSDAIYKLADHLDAMHIGVPIALDWGIEKNVRVLTNDRIRPEEVFGFTAEPDAVFTNRIKVLLKDTSRQYVVLWDRFAVYNRRKAFTQIASEMGLQVTETFIAHERSGLPVYVMLQAK